MPILSEQHQYERPLLREWKKSVDGRVEASREALVYAGMLAECWKLSLDMVTILGVSGLRRRDEFEALCKEGRECGV